MCHMLQIVKLTNIWKILGIEVGVAFVFDLVFGGGFLCVLSSGIVHLLIEYYISNVMKHSESVIKMIKGGVLSESSYGNAVPR